MVQIEIREFTYTLASIFYYFKFFIQEGCTHIKISQNDLIPSSLDAIENVEDEKLRGEIKITFLEDTKVQDAGGLLREWTTLILQEVVRRGSLMITYQLKLGLLVKTDTEDMMYKFQSNATQYSEQQKKDIFNLLGILVGKAMFERLPLSTFFDRSIIKYLLSQQVQLKDIMNYDRQLFNSWNYLLNDEPLIEELQLSFTIDQNGEVIPLVKDGENLIVTFDNKKEFIALCMDYYTRKSIQQELNSFLTAFFKIIPKDIIQIFSPEELEMIMFGLPFISLQDWKTHTQYKGDYNVASQHIIWFWEILHTWSQNELQQFLQFCTGSSRLPVEGFNKLESNRGEISWFCIQSINYEEANPFPKAHTCFNRLDLPTYDTYNTMENYLKATLNNILIGMFGLE